MLARKRFESYLRKKKCCIENPVTVIIYCQTDRSFKIFNIKNSSLFNEFVCKLGLFWHEWASLTSVLKAHECQKKSNLHTNELNTTFFFCSTSSSKVPNCLKSLKLAWRFVLTSCDIYQNPFTQEKIPKF
jgi:hypothetical protein